MGFVAAHAPGTDAVATAAEHTRSSGHALVTGPYSGQAGAARLRATARGAFLIADSGDWRGRSASVDEPTALHSGLDLVDLDTWAATIAATTGAAAVLTPSYHIRPHAWEVLDALLQTTARATDPRLITFVPINAAALEKASISSLLSCLKSARGRRLAVTFTGPKRPLADKERLSGLRVLLDQHRGLWILGVDPLVGTDALAHGAALVAVGTGHSTRHPDGPGDNTRGFSLDRLPGMLYLPLLEHRSARKLADWFANRPLGTCADCGLDPDRLDAIEADRIAVIKHNLHATGDLAAEVIGRPRAQRAAYLSDRRNEALTRHVGLKPLVAPVEADLTLRLLCELDDPQGRVTTPQGAWC
ncbi:hypothetical protein [Mycolicibacterium agri]|uniref:hypothetical protein n=1 Tax=Mycolicibacterium agri TaxID=36811 RepID=UPI0010556752|nr:hypothetical protein [Mycolicibacterium agri]